MSGFQPTPLTPPDFKEFIRYQSNLNSILRQTLHQPSKVEFDTQILKSKDKHNGKQRRGSNRSKQSDVPKLARRDPK